MAGFFEGSGILLQKAVGHGLGISPSKCMNQNVQHYLSTLEIPEQDGLCPVEMEPFDPALQA